MTVREGEGTTEETQKKKLQKTVNTKYVN